MRHTSFRRVYYDWARYFQINPPTLDYFLQEYAELYYLGNITDTADMEEMKSYHVNTAAGEQIARYMKRLKEMGVYDNTRVIVVSDHGDNISATPVFHP